MQRLFAVTALSAVVLVGCADQADLSAPALRSAKGAANAAAAAAHSYEITIQNLTSSQPFSPGVVATHTKQTTIVRVGDAASEGIRLIAENGDPGEAAAELDANAGVHDFVATSRPVGCVGCEGPFSPTLTLELDAAANANRLSLAIMLICTNDGFVGLDGVKLPGGFKPATFLANGYDAGTEANDESFTSIVDPCGLFGPTPVAEDGMNERTATDDVILPHPGIAGGADLDPSTYGWTEPAARVTVRRLK